MKQQWDIMGMPIRLVIEDESVDESDFDKINEYFHYVDDQYSPFKATSEVSRINDGLPESEWSDELKNILQLCEQTKQDTDGYFDVFRDGKLDPSGLVKGWAISQAARMLEDMGYSKFYIDAGGDVQVSGRTWQVGIRNPWDYEQVVKVLSISNGGVATSGTYEKGQHIYNPHDSSEIHDIASITVVGPDIYDADRFATAAFAMGESGIQFIEALDNYEAYMIATDKQATLTSGLGKYLETAQ